MNIVPAKPESAIKHDSPRNHIFENIKWKFVDKRILHEDVQLLKKPPRLIESVIDVNSSGDRLVLESLQEELTEALTKNRNNVNDINNSTDSTIPNNTTVTSDNLENALTALKHIKLFYAYRTEHQSTQKERNRENSPMRKTNLTAKKPNKNKPTFTNKFRNNKLAQATINKSSAVNTPRSYFLEGALFSEQPSNDVRAATKSGITHTPGSVWLGAGTSEEQIKNLEISKSFKMYSYENGFRVPKCLSKVPVAKKKLSFSIPKGTTKSRAVSLGFYTNNNNSPPRRLKTNSSTLIPSAENSPRTPGSPFQTAAVSETPTPTEAFAKDWLGELSTT